MRATKVPSFKNNSSNSGMGTLLGYMLAQKKNEQAQSNLPKDSFVTGADVNGVKYDTQQTGKPIPDAMATSMTEGASTAKDLVSNANQLMDSPNIQKQMGPMHPSAYMSGIGNLSLNLRSMLNKFTGSSNKDVKDFAEFKSSTGDIFQRYRKFLDGVRASVGGSKLETPIFPQTSAEPDIFLSQTQGLLKNMETNYNTVSQALKGQGYRTGGISDIFPSQGASDLKQRQVSQDTSSLEDELRQRYMSGK